MRRVIILIMCLLLQSSALSVEFAGGSGEPNDPYQIATAEQLIAMGSDSALLDKNFILVADIDLDPDLPGGRVFDDALIAPDRNEGFNTHSGTPFSGVLDGRGYIITNLHIVGDYGYDVGLFGKLGGLVKDLNLIDVVVSGSPCGAIAGLNFKGMILRCRVSGQVSGIRQVGGLVGKHWSANLMGCRAEVQVVGERDIGGIVGGGPGGMLIRCEVQAQVSGETNVGGLIGNQNDGQVIECRATGTVIGGNNVGGLVGDLGKTLILRSSAHCDVTAEQTAGGLAGSAHSTSSPLIADCYARGSITGSIVGGLAGEAYHNRFLNCYAACEIFPVQVEGDELLVGGLFGDIWVAGFTPKTDSCFWDVELLQTAVSTGSHPLELELGMGLTTEQMQDREVFENAGWDFDTVWMICEGDYPRHQWEAEECDEP